MTCRVKTHHVRQPNCNAKTLNKHRGHVAKACRPPRPVGNATAGARTTYDDITGNTRSLHHIVNLSVQYVKSAQATPHRKRCGRYEMQEKCGWNELHICESSGGRPCKQSNCCDIWFTWHVRYTNTQNAWTCVALEHDYWLLV